MEEAQQRVEPSGGQTEGLQAGEHNVTAASIPPSGADGNRDTILPAIGPVESAGVPAVSTTPASGNPFDGAFLTLDDLYRQLDTDDWLVTDLFCRGDMIMLYGDSGSGKTFVVIDLLLCLATGATWCRGQFEILTPRRAIYCTGEGKRGIRKRFAARHSLYLEQGGDTAPEILVLPMSPQLFDRESIFSVDNFIRSYEGQGFPAPDLVVLDTLNRASLGGDENSTKDATLIIAGAELIRDRLGAAVLIVHHTNKSGLYRGNTALHGSMDLMLEVKKSGQHGHFMRCEKLKDSSEFPDQAFHLYGYEDSAVIEWEGKSAARTGGLSAQILTVLSAEPGKRLSASEIAAVIDATPSNVAKCLRETLAGRYETGLKDPTQAAHKQKNPPVYWIKEPEQRLPYRDE